MRRFEPHQAGGGTALISISRRSLLQSRLYSYTDLSTANHERCHARRPDRCPHHFLEDVLAILTGTLLVSIGVAMFKQAGFRSRVALRV